MAWPIIIGRALLPSLNVYLTHFKNYLSLTQSPQRGIGIQNQNLLDEATNEISAIDVYGLETELDVGPTLSSKDSAIVLSIIKENYLNNSTQCTQLTNYKMKINLTHQTPIFTKPPSMVHVDALSRTEAVGAISELDLDFQLQVAQSRDPAIDSICLARWDGLSSSHNISHVLNATGSPQANGQVERVNQFLDSKTTDVSRDLNRIRSEAQENIKTSQARNEQYFADRNKPVPNFTEGDLVAIKYTDTSGVNKKLNCRFRGPYVIHKVLPHDRYVVRDVEGCQNTQMAYDGVLEADKLRRWASNM
ncbi:uncharacterized protein LOC126567245 [Anopheles maculipalpis]|uniref:uncharacterized protein LOC126567245 n=1 Tax=Anopheles maculipalpis TaxID=1496333 RepID=UPI00215998E1|nr:uncharacterized protein LOC126567245 [Anopheles maculipalpis]